MRFTNGAETTHPMNYTHPSYCDRGRCDRSGPNLHHRSSPTPFLPRQRGTTEVLAVSVSVERLDEVDEITGLQTEHPAELVASYEDGRQVRWGVEDFREFSDMVLGLYYNASKVAAAS